MHASSQYGNCVQTREGRGPLVHFAAQRKHLSFTVVSLSVMNAFRKELNDFDVSGRTIHFSAEKWMVRPETSKSFSSLRNAFITLRLTTVKERCFRCAAKWTSGPRPSRVWTQLPYREEACITPPSRAGRQPYPSAGRSRVAPVKGRCE